MRMVLFLLLVWSLSTVFGDEIPRMKKDSSQAVFRSMAAESFFWEGSRVTSEISDDDLIGCPTWSPESGTVLPLSPQYAIELSRAKLPSYVNEKGDFTISSLSIRRYRNLKFWFYRVGFIKKEKSAENDSATIYGWPYINNEFKLFVLMSGRVIEPRFNNLKQPDKRLRRGYQPSKIPRVKKDSSQAVFRSMAAESFFWEGSRVTSEISDDDLIGCPTWSPESGTVLPLSPQYAIELSRDKLPSYVNEKGDFTISSLSIRRYRNSKFWFYRVSFIKKEKSTENESATIYEWPYDNKEFKLFVLMSGRVIEPRFDNLE